MCQIETNCTILRQDFFNGHKFSTNWHFLYILITPKIIKLSFNILFVVYKYYILIIMLKLKCHVSPYILNPK